MLASALFSTVMIFSSCVLFSVLWWGGLGLGEQDGFSMEELGFFSFN